MNPLAVTSCFALWMISSTVVRGKCYAVVLDAVFASIVCVPIELIGTYSHFLNVDMLILTPNP